MAKQPRVTLEPGTASLELTAQQWQDIVTALDVLSGVCSPDLQEMWLENFKRGTPGFDRISSLICTANHAVCQATLSSHWEVKARPVPLHMETDQ